MTLGQEWMCAKPPDYFLLWHANTFSCIAAVTFLDFQNVAQLQIVKLHKTCRVKSEERALRFHAPSANVSSHSSVDAMKYETTK